MADYSRIMVFGGTGVTGGLIAELLAEHVGAAVVIAGRNGAAVQEKADALAGKLPQRQFSARVVDIYDRQALVAALADVDLLVIAAPVAAHMAAIGAAALESGTDLIDILVVSEVARALEPLADTAREKGRIIVTQAGFHPGVPGPMIRKAAKLVANAHSVHVGMAMRAQLRDARSASEITESVAAPTYLLRDGVWTEASYTDLRPFGFGSPFGTKSCYPLDMPEAKTVGLELGLANAGVYAAGFNWFVDYLVFPLLTVAMKLGGLAWARRVTPLFYWGNIWFSPKPSCIEMRAVAEGSGANGPETKSFCLYSDDPYGLTAHCVLAAVRQMRDGPLAAPGLHSMGAEIEPERLFADLEALGARTWTE
ncbi:MAG: saccharopine dehydrogenase NADP-binding domain-containing protein [Alphaproteobacteria bacterium]|nr:saccharopine dehydrogenase NADP-binding domain-containing protein [Alphaproteobacteria bacterium]